MEITIQEKIIKLVSPTHVDKKIMQETRYMFKRLPDIFINTPLYMGGCAAFATLIPADTTSKIIIAIFSTASLLTGGVLGYLKTHYNNEAKEYLFETENNAYIENFMSRRFKSLQKLEKAKKKNNPHDIELNQKYLIEDTARVLLQYVDECDQNLTQIKNEFNNFIKENHIAGEELVSTKFEAAKYRRPYDRDKFYILKVFGDNLDLFDLCENATKRKISNLMLDYKQYLVKNAAIEEEPNDVPKSAQNSQYFMSLWKSYGKLDMELCEEANGIFEELGMPDEYKYFTRSDILEFCKRAEKFEKDVKDDYQNDDLCSYENEPNFDEDEDKTDEQESKFKELNEIFGFDDDDDEKLR